MPPAGRSAGRLKSHRTHRRERRTLIFSCALAFPLTALAFHPPMAPIHPDKKPQIAQMAQFFSARRRSSTPLPPLASLAFHPPMRTDWHHRKEPQIAQITQREVHDAPAGRPAGYPKNHRTHRRARRTPIFSRVLAFPLTALMFHPPMTPIYTETTNGADFLGALALLRVFAFPGALGVPP